MSVPAPRVMTWEDFCIVAVPLAARFRSRAAEDFGFLISPCGVATPSGLQTTVDLHDRSRRSRERDALGPRPIYPDLSRRLVGRLFFRADTGTLTVSDLA